MAMDAAARQAKELAIAHWFCRAASKAKRERSRGWHAGIVKEFCDGRGTAAGVSAFGGETTVTVRGKGMGGRNQEFVLAAAIALEDVFEKAGPVTIFSGGTTAWTVHGCGGCDRGRKTHSRVPKVMTSTRASSRNNDSIHSFSPLDALVRTGPRNQRYGRAISADSGVSRGGDHGAWCNLWILHADGQSLRISASAERIAGWLPAPRLGIERIDVMSASEFRRPIAKAFSGWARSRVVRHQLVIGLSAIVDSASAFLFEFSERRVGFGLRPPMERLGQREQILGMGRCV